MTTGAKVALGIIIPLTIIGGGLGVYFLVKPKQGQIRTKNDKTQAYINGKWIDIGEGETVAFDDANYTFKNGTLVKETTDFGTTTTTVYKPSGSSCYDANVEKLQVFLNSKGANLDVDGCMGKFTKSAMEKYKVTFDGKNYKETPSNTTTTTPAVTQPNRAFYQGVRVRASVGFTAKKAEISLGNYYESSQSVTFKKHDFVGYVYSVPNSTMVYVKLVNSDKVILVSKDKIEIF